MLNQVAKELARRQLAARLHLRTLENGSRISRARPVARRSSLRRLEESSEVLDPEVLRRHRDEALLQAFGRHLVNIF